MASMSEADQVAMMLALQKELAEMKKAHEEAAKRNEEEIKNLQEENRRMKRLVEGVSSLAMTNQAGKSYATSVGLQAKKEMKNDFTLEMDGESHPNKTTNTTGTMGPERRHPFTDLIVDTPCRTSGKVLTGIGMMGRPTPTNIWMCIRPTRLRSRSTRKTEEGALNTRRPIE